MGVLWNLSPHLGPALLLVCALGLIAGSACSSGGDEPTGEVAGSGGESVAADPQADEVDEDEPEEPVAVGDRRLESLILLQLAADDDVDATRFTVSVVDGVATLSAPGVEPTELAAAFALAASIRGVAEVRPGEGTTDPGQVPPASPHDLEAEFEEVAEMAMPRDEVVELTEEEEDRLDLAASGDRPRTYVVEPGDSLSAIAAQTMGDGNLWHQLYEHNRNVIGSNPNGLQAGMELRIPQD